MKLTDTQLVLLSTASQREDRASSLQQIGRAQWPKSSSVSFSPAL
jgi:hypothetical protein